MLALGFLAESDVEAGKNEYVSADSSQFSGLWYSQESDNFLEVPNGNAVFLQCTLRKGYQNQQNLRYRIVEDELLLRSWRVGQLSVTGDTLTLTRGLENISEYKIAQEIPDECTGNAIEIKSISPPTVNLTGNSVLLVEVEYRLASSHINTR